MVTILLSYGIFEESNLQYKKYIDQAIELLDDAGLVIICGGLTNRKKDYSEAKSIWEYIKKVKPQLMQEVLLEEKSITTPQNLQFAFDILKEKKMFEEDVQIICDSIRAPKVFYFALVNRGVDEKEIYESLLQQASERKTDLTKNLAFKHKNVCVQGVFLDRKIEEFGQQILSTMIEIGGYHYPDVERQILDKRIREWALINQDS